MTTDLAAYYAARAGEYERVYEKPERLSDIARLHAIVSDYFRGCNVLEVACGTGYWTADIASVARSVIATDVSSEVLDVARAKQWSEKSDVTFVVADASDLSRIKGSFDAAFAGFWWSHVQRDRLAAFLEELHSRLLADARVMLVDNRYVEGSNIPISRTDSSGNTFQQRVLTNGDRYEVLKNFPTAAEIREQLETHRARWVDVVELEYYWVATYRLAAH